MMANKFDWGDTQALITEFTRLASRTLHSAEASASEFLDTSLFTGISGTDAADSILGASGQDLLLGGSGDDTLDGGAAADLLYGNKGLDFILGGSGDDTILGGQNGGRASGTPLALRTEVETISGGDGADIIYGNHGTDLLIGDAGDDTMFGGQDADTLSGGAGADSLLGNLGDDSLVGGAGADTFRSGAANGNDTIGDFDFTEGDRINNFSDVATFVDTTGGAFITYVDGSTVTLVGVTVASLSDDAFI
jgi:Ca2+-binding RTX toxin-like protein